GQTQRGLLGGKGRGRSQERSRSHLADFGCLAVVGAASWANLLHPRRRRAKHGPPSPTRRRNRGPLPPLQPDDGYHPDLRGPGPPAWQGSSRGRGGRLLVVVLVLALVILLGLFVLPKLANP